MHACWQTEGGKHDTDLLVLLTPQGIFGCYLPYPTLHRLLFGNW
jgi:hypothetical protein